MSDLVNHVLLEEAAEQADRVGVAYYFNKIDELIAANDLEGLYYLVQQMKQIDIEYAD